MKFIHTADWQIGKPFARIRDANKRVLVQKARIDAIKRIGAIGKECGVEFVLVAGDLFDSSTPDKATVSAACSVIGQIDLPVIVIPGNHDHGGAGCVWEQDFFTREQVALAPNLNVLREAVPFELESAVLLPCPLPHRIVSADPTEWLRDSDVYAKVSPGKPRIVLAHGSTQSFSGEWDDDEEGNSASNLINLDRLPNPEIDYIALGDWHGTKQVSEKAWFAGTPELDRFPKGGEHDPGNILVVEVQRGKIPQVSKVATASLQWSELVFDLADDAALNELENRLAALMGKRTNENLLRLTLTGSVGIEASNRLEQVLESLVARLLRLKIANQTLIAPTVEEIQALTQRGSDPLIANVARKLVEQSVGDNDDGRVARIALRELHAACMQEASL
ncbi:MAG: DNA repair exonuclease [Acidobacteriota bacterium]